MENRLIGNLPKIGIRPAIDARLGGVRESLENQTMNMARNVDKLFRPSAWSAFGMDKEAADYRACKNYGPLYK